MDLRSFCKALPKLELHAHLNGSISEKTLRKLYKLANLPMETFDVIFQVCPNRNLVEWFFMFELVYKATSTPLALKIATEEVIDDFAKDNVIYVELRTTPRAVHGKMSKRDYLNAIIDGINEGTSKHPNIIVKLIISINRCHADGDENFNLAIEYDAKYPNLIVGIDVCGNPSFGNWQPLIIEEARERGFHTVVHTAEVDRIDETIQILQFKPDRIGHGIFIHPNHGGSEEAWNLLRQNEIPVECCLTSNVCCQAYASYRHSHMKELLAENMPFAICTDDKGIFSTELSLEYERAAAAFELSGSKLWEISNNSIGYSFATDEEKEKLYEVLEKWKKENNVDMNKVVCN